jgi:hypothetical protein
MRLFLRSFNSRFLEFVPEYQAGGRKSLIFHECFVG